MQRLIVTSATYRQSSKVTPALLERDPENRLLARGPRFRLPAEMIRDKALAASGLLNPEIGGPSVLPYQPTGLWEELAFGDGFSAQTYEQSTARISTAAACTPSGSARPRPHRWRPSTRPTARSAPAAARVTNTPLQALVLLNDPTYVEAARALAERTLLGRRHGREEPSELRLPAGHGAQADRQGS